ncbi:MAG TPA: ATP-binding protein [Thermoanaerobaculia bacterium]|nr:ATP-binding protein [Thermoanaerobaculia bacterium]
MHTRFRRELSALPAVFAMSEEFCARDETLESEKYTLDFVLEEIFTNLVKYGSGEDDEILISIDQKGQELVLSVTDFSALPFDMRDAAAPDVTLPLEERTPGGLGIHLVRRMVDRLDYDYDAEHKKSTITIYKEVR